MNLFFICQTIENNDEEISENEIEEIFKWLEQRFLFSSNSRVRCNCSNLSFSFHWFSHPQIRGDFIVFVFWSTGVNEHQHLFLFFHFSWKCSIWLIWPKEIQQPVSKRSTSLSIPDRNCPNCRWMIEPLKSGISSLVDNDVSIDLYDGLMDHFDELAMLYLGHYAHRMTFLQLVDPLILKCQKFIKVCQVQNFVKVIRGLAEKVQENVELIEERREKTGLNIKDQKQMVRSLHFDLNHSFVSRLHFHSDQWVERTRAPIVVESIARAFRTIQIDASTWSVRRYRR